MPYPKFIARAPGGGQAVFTAVSETLGGGAQGLNPAEMAQDREARLLAQPANGGDLTTAKTYLESCGWRVLWDGPPPRTQDDTWTIRLPADLKLWAQAHGGPDLVRQLLQAERERQQAE